MTLRPAVRRPLRTAVLGAVALALTWPAVAAGAAPDGRGPARPHGSCPADPALLFCEDFENDRRGPVAGGDDWGVATRDGALSVVRDRASRPSDRRPGQVLNVHTEGNGFAFLEVRDFAAPGNSFFGRMWLRVEEFPTAPDWAHFTLVEATGTGDGSVVRPIGGQWVPTVGDGAALWGVGSDGGPTGDWTDWRESAPAESGTWTCVEWRQDARDNQVDVWLDGEHQPDLTVSTDRHGGNQVDFVFPEFDTVRLGWQLYQGNPTPSSYDLLLDDIALATERVGCGGGPSRG